MVYGETSVFHLLEETEVSSGTENLNTTCRAFFITPYRSFRHSGKDVEEGDIKLLPFTQFSGCVAEHEYVFRLARSMIDAIAMVVTLAQKLMLVY